MLGRIQAYLQAKREAKTIEQERANYVAAIRRKQREYNLARIGYDAICKESKDSRLIEIAYDHMKVKEQELEFMLSEARQSNIRAYWIDIKIS